MIINFILGLTLFSSLGVQDGDMIRQIMRKHPDGSAYVVLYFKVSTQELVKEEVFFPNGKLQWNGTYKNDLEDGIWKYYYENGRLKSEQSYSKGKEDGTFTEFDQSGRMTKQSTYKNGKLEREMTF